MRHTEFHATAIFALCLASAIFAENAPAIAIKQFPLRRFSIGSSRGLPKIKSNAAQATVTYVVRDSIAFYDFSRNAYIPGAVLSAAYSPAGQPESETETVFNDSIASLHGVSSYNELYTFDPQGLSQTIVKQKLQNNAWVNKSKMVISPNPGLFTGEDGSTAGQGFYTTCTGNGLFLIFQKISEQMWDTNTGAWKNDILDTVISLSADKKVIVSDLWDTTTSSFQDLGFETLYVSGGRVNKTVLSIDTSFDMVFSAVYDASGNEIEEIHESSISNSYSKSRIIQSFDSHNHLLSSIQQDSLDTGWDLLDSCPKMFFTYSYDGGGLVLSRADSTWNSDNDIVVDKHFFTYQTFQAAIFPRQLAGNRAIKNFSISHAGMVKTSAPVSIDLYSLSGKRLAEIAMNKPGSLWNSCSDKGLAVNAGLYVAKIQGTDMSVAVWHK